MKVIKAAAKQKNAIALRWLVIRYLDPSRCTRDFFQKFFDSLVICTMLRSINSGNIDVYVEFPSDLSVDASMVRWSKLQGNKSSSSDGSLLNAETTTPVTTIERCTGYELDWAKVLCIPLFPGKPPCIPSLIENGNISEG